MQQAVATPNYGRRILWLGFAVVVVIVLYTAGWFWLADRLEREARVALESLGEKGIAARCENPQARGYPFRLGLFCDSIAFEQASEQVSVSAGAFRSAGQIYDPSRLVAELDGPAQISLPGAGPVALDWDVLRASTRLATPLPERISLQGSALKVAPAGGETVVSAETFEAHMRPDAADLDVAVRFAGLSLAPQVVRGRNLAPLSGDADIKVFDGVRLLDEGAHGLRGKSGKVRKMTLTIGEEGSLSLSGPISVDEAGLIDADLEVSLHDPKGLARALSDAFPEFRRQIEQGSAGLSFLGSNPKLPLKIVKSSATLGFIPLGRIPPLE
jgi:hypothetical protein